MAEQLRHAEVECLAGRLRQPVRLGGQRVFQVRRGAVRFLTRPPPRRDAALQLREKPRLAARCLGCPGLLDQAEAIPGGVVAELPVQSRSNCSVEAFRIEQVLHSPAVLRWRRLVLSPPPGAGSGVRQPPQFGKLGCQVFFDRLALEEAGSSQPALDDRLADPPGRDRGDLVMVRIELGNAEGPQGDAGLRAAGG